MFDEVANEWLYEYKKPLRRNPPLKQLEVIVRLHIIPYFGNKRIMRIRRAEVKRWLQQYADMKDEQGRESIHLDPG
ncbi:hypothetical protein [Paenibacillus larvae]|uniref:hypothetical protein n=1 Tax=Paenibacillus larvae TaxID=1464 RepID=UPI00289243A5|nr:hypothetical protein [Paenibacillus larvae]MDT2191818.1 hypothetical protein [Paenibacillus larvae]